MSALALSSFRTQDLGHSLGLSSRLVDEPEDPWGRGKEAQPPEQGHPTGPQSFPPAGPSLCSYLEGRSSISPRPRSVLSARDPSFPSAGVPQGSLPVVCSHPLPKFLNDTCTHFPSQPRTSPPDAPPACPTLGPPRIPSGPKPKARRQPRESPYPRPIHATAFCGQFPNRNLICRFVLSLLPPTWTKAFRKPPSASCSHAWPSRHPSPHSSQGCPSHSQT